ncbi:hypothetical protein [Streptomyces sp. YS415]|uniref:hypothetical protein n=1 Tax=Streptomyces sp. YS415 TaxID=2944806 RepID=UPI002021AD94|nr:hypothetical protein [Streptomyces sp. YS415]MCL7429779.1 hypothetical protein [Streptomyces sp. YS415]
MTMPQPAPPPGEPDGVIVLHGYLDDETLPDDLTGTLVRIQLVVSPTEDRIDELVMPCTVTNPEMAHAVVNDGTSRRNQGQCRYLSDGVTW